MKTAFEQEVKFFLLGLVLLSLLTQFNMLCDLCSKISLQTMDVEDKCIATSNQLPRIELLKFLPRTACWMRLMNKIGCRPIG
jgi:hypothetical protein